MYHNKSDGETKNLFYKKYVLILNFMPATRFRGNKSLNSYIKVIMLLKKHLVENLTTDWVNWQQLINIKYIYF